MMMRGVGDGDPLCGRIGLAASLPLHPSVSAVAASEMVATSGVFGSQYRGKDDRVPQWGQQETRELISIRGELERDFTVARRNKALWESVSTMMKKRGYNRSPDQCKCKWKNLVNRYKGKETTDPENGRQMPFFDELHAIFTERARNIQHRLLDSESGASHSKKKLKRLTGERSDCEFSDEEDDEEDDDSDNERALKSRKKRTEMKRGTTNQPQQTRTKATNTNSISNNIREMLQEFLQHQRVVETQWQDMMERRAQERHMLEQEWRQSMEKLERERLLLDKAWREREEQRRLREESRAEKRDALLNALLNKIIQDDL